MNPYSTEGIFRQWNFIIGDERRALELNIGISKTQHTSTADHF